MDRWISTGRRPGAEPVFFYPHFRSWCGSCGVGQGAVRATLPTMANQTNLAPYGHGRTLEGGSCGLFLFRVEPKSTEVKGPFGLQIVWLEAVLGLKYRAWKTRSDRQSRGNRVVMNYDPYTLFTILVGL